MRELKIKFIIKNIEEIEKSKALRIYGGFLALTHIVTWYFWFSAEGFQNILLDPLPICWSFMNKCQVYRGWSDTFWESVSYFYLGLSILVSFFFFFTPKVRVSYFLFLGITLFKFTLFLADYRLMGNYHYMPFIVSLFYLLILDKKNSIMGSLVVFYISAGLLKLDTEWLSGSALLENFFIGGEVLEWLLAYTIIFEVLVVSLSLSSSLLLFLFSFPQIIGFHALSWHIVGYFYPCMMFLLLMAFPLFRFKFNKNKLAFINDLNIKKASLISAGILLSIQILPRVLSPDLAVDSQGRLFTLNMLDARVQCEHFSYVVSDDGKSIVETSSERDDLGTRISCDPLVYLSEAQRLCLDSKVKKVPVYLVSKKSTHNDWKMVLNYKNYCDENKKVSWWGGL